MPMANPPPSPVVESETPKDNHGITIAAMALFVLLALGAVAFLYYQNQQLKQMLAGYQTQTISPSPVATANATANWTPYQNAKAFFTFKYPAIFSIDGKDCIGDNTCQASFLTMNKGDFGIEQYSTSSNCSGRGVAGTKSAATSAVSIGGITASLISDSSTSLDNQAVYSRKVCVSLGTKKSVLIYLNTASASELDSFNPILSTFQFTSPSSSPTPTTIPTSSPSTNLNINY